MKTRPRDYPPRAERRRDLYWIGGLTAAVYLATCLYYLGGAQPRTRTARELFAWFIVLALLPLFYKGYRAVEASNTPQTARLVVVFAAVFCLLAALTVPFHSTDAFGYINRGWQQVHYNLNPYVYRLADTPGWQQDPMLREHWIYNPNPYGFLFALLARLLAWLGGGNWYVTLALFKAVNVLAYALTGWLVWSGARLLGHERPLLALYAFLWNPLILMHHLANGHNDVLVGCLVALALYLVVRGAYVWVFPVLSAATLVKYAPALLVPPAIIFVWKKKGWRPVVVGCLLGALIAVAVSAPYLKDWHLIKMEDIRGNATLIDNSLHSFLIHIYGTVAQLITPLAQFRATVDSLIKIALRGGLVLFFLALLWRRRAFYSERALVEDSVLLLFVLICVASSKLNGWYLGMILGPSLLLPDGHWLRRVVLLVSCAQLLSLTFFKQAYMLNYFAMVILPCLFVYRQARAGRAQAERDDRAPARGRLEEARAHRD